MITMLDDPAGRARVDGIMRQTGLLAHRSDYPHQLSGGLRRRAALARAFVIEPEVLLLDEPFVSLDEAAAYTLRRLLLAIWQARPVTVLFVTHNLREAVMLADRIVFMSGQPGHVVGDEPVMLARDRRGDANAVGEIAADLQRKYSATD